VNSDAELVAHVLDGRDDAFAELVARHYDACWRFARRMLRDGDDAEDAVQESFVRAYRALAAYRERHQFRAWLFSILVNRCRSMLARDRRRAEHVVRDDAAVARAVAPDRRPRTELRDALQVALDTLEPLLREAVLLKHGEGLDYAEMASITGASVPALKMRVSRGCEAMRSVLGEFAT
jgi:RNA polymerase sigma-70 factor (ECF subfamily)